MKIYSLVGLLVLLPYCGADQVRDKELKEQPIQLEEKEQLLINLDSSTKIIMHLLKTDKLADIFDLEQGVQQEGLDRLIKNFSPAERAFEAEVLNSRQPTVLFFFNEKFYESWQQFHTMMQKLAEEFQNQAKFVEIDSEELFKISQNCEIDTYPTFVIIHNREELKRLEVPRSEKELEREIKAKLNSIEKKHI